MQPPPPDVARLIASVEGLRVRDILNLCRVDRTMNASICRNKLFWSALLQQRSGYSEGRLQDFQDISQIQRELHLLEKPFLSIADALDIFRRTWWSARDTRPETIYLDDRRHLKKYRKTAVNPYVNDLLSRKIAFAYPLTVRINFRDALEFTSPFSLLDLIAAINNYYIEQGIENYLTRTIMNNNDNFIGYPSAGYRENVFALNTPSIRGRQ